MLQRISNMCPCAAAAAPQSILSLSGRQLQSKLQQHGTARHGTPQHGTAHLQHQCCCLSHSEVLHFNICIKILLILPQPPPWLLHGVSRLALDHVTVIITVFVFICLLLLQIASLLDNGSVRIEGVMPGGSKSSYTLPLDVYCFGTTEAMRSTLQQRLLRAGGEVVFYYFI